MSKHSNRMPVTTTTSRERIAAQCDSYGRRVPSGGAAHAATDATVTEEKAPKARKTPRDKFVQSIDRHDQQLSRLFAKMAGSVDNTMARVSVLLQVSDAIKAARELFAALPADWSPRARKSPGVPSFIVGSVVSVRDKKREQAAAILDEGELVGLTVVKIADKIVRLVTPSGATVAAPKAWFRSDKKA